MNTNTVLVINAGSSSIKFQVIDPHANAVALKGIIEEIGTEHARAHWNAETKPLPHCSYDAALEELAHILELGGFQDAIGSIGHRVVHGGETFFDSVCITDEVLQTINRYTELAPLHNPANTQGIRFFLKHMPSLPQVAVFDTAFHQTLPPKAFLYAIPYSLYTRHKIRRYGFHGTSHKYVYEQALQRLKLEKASMITAHLGNGCSVCAIKNGKSVDTSMGFTPLEGVVMGRRCGDIDPSIALFLEEKEGLSTREVLALFNKQSGLFGLSEQSSDMRHLLRHAHEGNTKARLAIDVFCYRLAKTIASYFVPLGTVDALVFTGGIGENAEQIRKQTMEHLSAFSFRYPPLVVPTDEEKMIAIETLRLTQEAP